MVSVQPWRKCSHNIGCTFENLKEKGKKDIFMFLFQCIVWKLICTFSQKQEQHTRRVFATRKYKHAVKQGWESQLSLIIDHQLIQLWLLHASSVGSNHSTLYQGSSPEHSDLPSYGAKSLFRTWYVICLNLTDS